MNRLKLWLFALVVLSAAAVAAFAHTQGLRTDALAALDARLGAARIGLSAADAALSREAAALAALVAREPTVVQALAPPSPAPAAPLPRRRGARAQLAQPAPVAAVPDEAALDAVLDREIATALASAARALGGEAPAGAVALSASRASLERRSAAAGEAAQVLKDAVYGSSPRVFVRRGGLVYAAAGASAGDAGGVVVLLPVGADHARQVAARAGVDVTFVAPGAKPTGTLAGPDAELAAKAAMETPGVTVDAGRLAPVDLGVSDALPRAPLLLGSAPAHRALALPVPGVKGAFAVLSAAVAPSLAPVAALQWKILGLVAVALVLAFLFGLLVRSAEPAPMVPEGLLAAAARIEAGDFAARAPELAGKLGTIAAALNRAAETAAAHVAAGSSDPFAAARDAEPPAPAAELSPAPAPAPAPEPEPTPAPAAPPVATPAPVAPAAPAAEAAAPAELLQAAARTAPATPEEDEQAHWQQVFGEFLRTRTECGEPAEGLTFERFRQKLASNKAALVAKYSCRTVRFQVYVKEGKAALKATPVR
jgi:hypothetical protein